MLEIIKARKPVEGVERYFIDWANFASGFKADLEKDFKRDIVVKKITSKLKRLNRRKLKKALSKIEGTVFKGVYPLSVTGINQTENTNMTLQPDMAYQGKAT